MRNYVKQYIVLFSICLSIFLVLVGCNTNPSNDVDLLSGTYFKDGAYAEVETPYLHLDFENNSFRFGQSMVMSYAEGGTFKIEAGKLIAESQSATFVFEIKNAKTLVLIDSGDSEIFQESEGSKFIYYKD